MVKILVINGPNMNLIGERERDIYGSWSLHRIMTHTEELLQNDDVKLVWFQSNSEGSIVQRIQDGIRENISALIVNPAGYTHTSVAIRDALAMFPLPIVEVHLSNTHAREKFRQRKLTSAIATTIIEGAGAESYYLAVQSLLLKWKFHVSNH